ncbi:MAG: tRNA uracil 4-sulfurtransferase ThiI [Oscillospiraceae bacterium]|nr:tRNA uracil 4-sulfurtransferase ThiI [Oscillospiraceae bacterium]
MRELIMAYQGEMALKGLNRVTFENTLVKNLRFRLKSAGDFKIYKAQSTLYIEPENEYADMQAAYERTAKTFGLAALSRAAVCEKTLESICETAVAYLEEQLREAATFKVVCRRADKSFPLTSMELAREVGAAVLSHFHHLKVDVHHPALTVFCEVRDFAAYVHADKTPGAGGLPVSTSGKAALMLSGGIDSPVAAYMMAKRGLNLMAVHFASPPYTSPRAQMKVEELAQQLAVYTGGMALLAVPFTKTQEAIRDNAPPPLFTVLMRRSMMRITSTLGQKYGCEGIITGESLAQVASQTLRAIACTDAAQELPVLRPLIGMDKTEIVDIARRIGTFETSIEPYEDCCTIFTPPHPKTKPSLQEIEKAEAGMDLALLEAEAAENAQRIMINL